MYKNENYIPQNGGVGVNAETVYYTQRGLMEICRWSRQPKADLFMDWAWDIIESYKFNKTQDYVQLIKTNHDSLTQAITTLTNNMVAMQQDIQSIKAMQTTEKSTDKDESLKKKLPEKKYSRWKTRTFTKLNTLLSYVNKNSDENMTLPNIIHLIIAETEDTYSIEINDYVDAYKSEFSLDSNPYAIDVINHYKDIKDMFTLTLDSILERLHITESIINNRPKNIFDELAAQLQN